MGFCPIKNKVLDYRSIPESPSKGHPGRLTFEKKEQQLIMKYLHHAVGAVDHGGITQEMTGKMFDVLTEEETATLLQLLEKLSDHWISMAPERPGHHREQH